MTGRVCVFGEVLYDHFPGGARILGGAPFNVAWHLQAFGLAPLLVSRVGGDVEGRSVRAAMREWGMDLAGLQADPELPTGRVDVSLDAGEPAYSIAHPVAFDAIEPAPAPAGCSLLYHGSLALREPVSRSALERIRDAAGMQVFLDVNLRAPWWEREAVQACMAAAHWVKLNEDELGELQPGPGEIRDRTAALLRHCGLLGLLLTRGARGAELHTAAGIAAAVEPRPGLEVADTVGAGDAFAAVMILGLVRRWDPGSTLQRAQAFASAICACRGATVSDRRFYRPFLADWELGEGGFGDV